jgi:hypothetical protein
MGLIPFLMLWAGVTIVLITGWTALPLIIFALFPTSVRSWFLEDEEAQKILAAHPLQMETVEEMKALGFILQGVRVEKLPLWGVQIHAISLASPETHTYGEVLFSVQQKPVGIYFFTPLDDGGMVFTRNQAQQPEFESGRESVKNISGAPLTAVYAAHVARQRGRPLPGASLFDTGKSQVRHAAAMLFYHTTYGRQQARKYLTMRPVRNFAIALALFCVFFGLWLVPFLR